MNIYHKIVALGVLLAISISANAQLGRAEIKSLVKHKEATVGVAAICGNQSMNYQNNVKYPLASVFKLHVAMCALNKMEQEGTSLDAKTEVGSEWMYADTYSPMRDQAGGKSITLTWRQLLDYCITQSDNIACDRLIDYCGGIDVVDKFIRSLGFKHFKLERTERELNADKYYEFRNWSRPVDLVNLLKKLDDGEILSAAHRQYLIDAMSRATTGQDKMLAGLPKGTPLAHKTGHSGRFGGNAETPQQPGMQIADNDVGIITLPNGKKLYLVIFVKLSHYSNAENAKLIAEITNIVYKNAIALP